MGKNLILVVFLCLFGVSCGEGDCPMDEGKDLTGIAYDPIDLEVEYPDYFPRLEQPSDNIMTVEGVDLGRFLFYDPLLSLDSTISCSSCHLQTGAFTDNLPMSIGVHGATGSRSSMSLINVGFSYDGLFWDGRSEDLEEQALLPVEDPLEMQDTWANVESKLQASELYPEKFRKAFGIENTNEITRELITKALSQFQRTIVSYESKFDRYKKGEAILTDDELWGYSMFIDDVAEITDAQCDHCHSLPFGTSNGYFNNGLQPAQTLLDFADLGRGSVTNIEGQNGFFRAPTLRNIVYSAPYMHNGSLATLDDVIEHYASGGHFSPNKDPLIDDIHMDDYDKKALKAFLLTLTDESVLTKNAYSDPFQ